MVGLAGEVLAARVGALRPVALLAVLLAVLLRVGPILVALLRVALPTIIPVAILLAATRRRVVHMIVAGSFWQLCSLG